MRVILFLLSFIWLNALSEEIKNDSPKFEWGAGFLSLYGNHYRGSDQTKYWIFPMPYFTYSSNRIEAEPSFIRGIFYRGKWITLKLSLMLGLNSENKKNQARSGMPPIDYTIEAGPMFIVHLWSATNNEVIINFEWPLRAIFATDLSYLKHVGLYTVPYLSIKNAPSSTNWNLSSELTVSPMYADANYHQYFYGVDQQFVREGRPYYKAHGGYSGFQTALVLNKKINKTVIIPFIRWDYLKGAIFEDSPLVKTKNYFVSGLGMFWLFN